MTRQSPSGDFNSNNSGELWPTFDLEYTIELVDDTENVFIQPSTIFKNPFSSWLAIDADTAVPVEEIP